MKVYAACRQYEGCFAVFSTLEKAIEVAGKDAYVIEEWPVDPATIELFPGPTMWSSE